MGDQAALQQQQAAGKGWRVVIVSLSCHVSSTLHVPPQLGIWSRQWAAVDPWLGSSTCTGGPRVSGRCSCT